MKTGSTEHELIAAFTFILVLIVLSGCCLIQTQKYSITFDTDGGSTVNPQSVQENEKATRPAADPTKPGYSFDNWYAEDTFATVWNFNTPITEDTILYAKWSLVGNAGPAGGLIFYDKGFISDGWRYLEAAPQGWKDTDDPLISWGSPTLIGSTSDSVGSGEANTENIFSVLGEGTYAAKACIDYSVTVNSVEYNDWFLPSWDELDLMYKNLYQKGLGGFMYAWYWSSSEADRSAAKFQSFQDGNKGPYSQKSTERRVRPVRAY